MSVKIINNIRHVPAALLRFTRNHENAAFYLSQKKVSSISADSLIDSFKYIQLIRQSILKMNMDLRLVDFSVSLSVGGLGTHPLIEILHRTDRLGLGFKKVTFQFGDRGKGCFYKTLFVLTERKLFDNVRVGGSLPLIYKGELVHGRIIDISSILLKSVDELGLEDEKKPTFRTVFGTHLLHYDLRLQERSGREKADEDYNEWFHFACYIMDHIKS